MSTERESMTLLHSIESAQDFKKAMDILEKDMPNSANTFTSMKFWCEGTTTSIIHRFFAYPWSDPVCFMAIRFNNHIDVPSIFFHAKNGKDRQEKLILFFKELEKSVPELFWKRELLFECNRAVDTDDIADYISQYGQLEILPRGAAPAPSFFVPQEKWNNLLQLDIRPPEGYYFDTLTEADIPAVSETWRFRRGDDNIQMKFKFGYLPTVCLRCQSDHSLAAFEMLDVSGFMTHLFTFPQHRKKGLAKIVELKLAQKLIANNVTPFKSVVYDNEPGLAISHKSQWFQPMEKRKWHNFYPNSSSA